MITKNKLINKEEYIKLNLDELICKIKLDLTNNIQKTLNESIFFTPNLVKKAYNILLEYLEELDPILSVIIKNTTYSNKDLKKQWNDFFIKLNFILESQKDFLIDLYFEASKNIF